MRQQQQQLQPEATVADAILKGYFAQVRYLLQQSGGANGREFDNGRTPLILCALVEDASWALSLARLLLEQGAKVGLKDRHGLNALHYACVYGREQLAEIFLDAIDFRVNEPDRHHNTALHYAVASGSRQLVESLISVLHKFQLPISLPNHDGITPLMLAYRHGHFDIADLLLSNGADAHAVDSFNKSTMTYEQEALEKRRVEEETKEEKKRGRRLRFDDVDGWRNHQTRLKSAPPSRGSRTFKEEQQEKRRNQMYHRMDSELIHCASGLDKRNNPMEVFKLTPLEFFSDQQRHQQPGARPLTVSGTKIRPISAKPRLPNRQPLKDTPASNSADPGPVRSVRIQSAFCASRSRSAQRRDDASQLSATSMCSDDSRRSQDSKAIEILSSKPEAASVKRDIPKIFYNFEFHCSQLYRPPPKAPDPSLYATDFNSRFLQPPPADADVAASATPTGRRKKEAKKPKKSMAALVDSKKKAGRISRAAFNRDD